MNSLPSFQFSFWRSKRLPLLLQTEAAECGLACLSMVASYWGHAIDIASMRRRFSVSLKGATLKSLIGMARGLELQARPLKLDIQHLQDLKLPCILHWDMNHFVVLKSVTKFHAVIHDPGIGSRRLRLEDLGNHFTGIALELTPTAFFKPQQEVQPFTLRSLMGRVVGLNRGLVQLVVLGLGLQVFAMIAPFYMQWLVDEALLAADRDLVTVLGSGFLLLVVLQAATGAVRSWITTVLTTSLNMQWLGNAFAHLMRLPLPYFENRHTGDIVSRFSSIETIQHSLTTQLVSSLIDGVLVVGTLTMMCLYSASLAGLTCVAVAIYVLLRWLIFRPLREAKSEQIIHAAKQQTHFLESVRGVQSIRLFGRAEERRLSWMNALADQFNAEVRVARLTISYQMMNSLLFNAERVIIIWLAALAVLDNKFSIGMLLAFISYKEQFSQRTASLVDTIFELRIMRLHGERVADIVLTRPEDESTHAEVDVDKLSPAIEVRNLSFRYSDNDPDILSNINLTIPSGQCIALTGASGCGKTTLLKLLLGLLEPTSGEILIDGVEISKLGLNNYRRIVGAVMQEDTLFAGSIADNISFFDAHLDMERVQACAELAAIHVEIAAMPMSYNTIIGDIGSGLSGGQKQRLLLARAIYRRPKVLMLDEATSHLDIWNEQAVNTAIKNISLTRIIVAHRPETISMAERVVILQQGNIIKDFSPSSME